MNVLAIDCSTDVMAVAVGKGYGGDERAPRSPKHPYREEHGHAPAPGRALVTVSLDAGFRHAERLMGAVDFCLAESGITRHELDLLACAGGPGSFTGLRIAMATVKGMSMGLGKPFVVVPTLDAYAAEWAGCAPVIVPVLDAKRSRFFYAVYEAGRRVLGPFDDGEQSIIERVGGFPEVLFVGPDAEMLDAAASDRSGFRIAAAGRRAPTGSLVELAVQRYRAFSAAAADASPEYLRASDAEEAAAQGQHG